MRWVIAALATLALGAVLTPQPSADTAPITAVDEPTLIIDVRTAEEFAAGHFPGAINIPHEDIIEGIQEYNVGKDQTVLLYCRSGNRSGQAEVRLQSAGFSGAKNVGGLNALLAATGRTAALPNH
jgi:phage shock protein E